MKECGSCQGRAKESCGAVFSSAARRVLAWEELVTYPVSAVMVGELMDAARDVREGAIDKIVPSLGLIGCEFTTDRKLLNVKLTEAISERM